MEESDFLRSFEQLFLASDLKNIPAAKALSAELAGVQIFTEPLVGAAASDDARFAELKVETEIGPDFQLPQEWLPGCRSVVSFFFPFTDVIRDSNKLDARETSTGWMNARIEGQAFIDSYARAVVEMLQAAGYAALAPTLDARFRMAVESPNATIGRRYSSNWSERHVAYVCGLGTFGLSRGLITEKGIAGRFTSVVTDAVFTPSWRRPSRYDEDCIRCGDCIKNCPVGAISFAEGKNQDICWDFLRPFLEEHSPYYGCGKCQVNVSCEMHNPRKHKAGEQSPVL